MQAKYKIKSQQSAAILKMLLQLDRQEGSGHNISHK